MYPKHLQEKKSGSRLLTVVLSILIILLAALCILGWMLFSDPRAGESLPAPSDAAVTKVISATVSGREAVLTPDEVAGWLNRLIQNNADAESGKEITALSIAVKQNGTADVYFPVRYRGKTFGVTMNLSPSFDKAAEQMEFAVNAVHVGRLPVPVHSALNLMESRLPSVLSRQGDTLCCKTGSLFRTTVSGVSAQLNMKELKTQNGMFCVGFAASLGLPG